MNICTDQFKAYLQAKPSADVAKALVLLACRQKDKDLLAEVVVYFSRSFGTHYLTDFLIDDVEPILKATECRWMWKAMKEGNEGDRNV